MSPTFTMPSAFEPHFKPLELAKMWNLDPEQVRDLFRGERVIRLERRRRGIRTYVSMRIPQSVADRAYARLMQLGRLGCSRGPFGGRT